MQLIASDQQRVIIGLGMTGLSCARFFRRSGIPFAVVDSRDAPPGLAAFKAEFPDVTLHVGGISDDALRGATELVVSPGVALEEPAIARATSNGVAVTGDIDLFRRQVSAPIVAITGSNGKSTVTTLVGEMAQAAGVAVAVGGNIGVPVLDLLDGPDQELFVLELSSFQLERTANLAATVATVLNMSADHMDRYSSMVGYHQAKHRIFRQCQQVVINRRDPLSRPLVGDDVVRWTFGLDKPDFRGFGVMNENGADYLAFEFTPLMPVSDLKMAGSHNVENALAALALGHAVGLPVDAMLSALREFTGLPHRCQFVAEVCGVKFFNDSKGTNAGASIAAMQGLQGAVNRLVLIAGGQAKGADLSPLLPAIKAYARGVVVMGEAADDIAALVGDALTVEWAVSMAQAVAQALMLAEAGDAVLLSPACASFDMFDNYMHRGDEFCRAVMSLSGRSQ